MRERLRAALPTLLLIAAAVIGLKVYGWHMREVGRRDHAIQVRDSAIATLMREAARLDTVYLRDTVRLTQVRTVTNSILRRDTLRLTDTLIHLDTVIQIVERERLACDAVVATCEARAAVQQARGDSLDLQLKAERSKGKVFGVKLPSRELMFSAGVLAGILLGR